jgi:hypothetical protein
VTGLLLKQLETEFPDITVEKVEYLTNLKAAHKKGVSMIPAIVSGDKKLSGFLLTKNGIRRFFEYL